MTDRLADRRAIIGGSALLAGAGALSLPMRARAADTHRIWQPAAEAQDSWMDKPGTRHRLMFDTTAATAAESAMFYVDTYYAANKSGYGLDSQSLGVIIVLRHMSTPFGYNDVVWAKHGAALADKLKLEGERAIRAVKGNPLLTPAAAGDGEAPKSKGDDEAPVTLASLAAKGVTFAVCGVATRGIAAQIAKVSGTSVKKVEDELKANLIPGAVIVPAGIVAVDRAQEHGYAFVNIPQ
ncbi:MAG TPA: hypothetical protein VN109_15090 [Devosia sp.]|jgi:intracellular sulfur oxidation DsrE/DsrF family protein|nr:hypothetical protein [Devosia sp.]